MEGVLKSWDALASDNVKVTPVFVGGSNDRLKPGEASCALAQGGLDQSQLFTTDLDGAPRTAPWSIGAHERDGPCK